MEFSGIVVAKGCPLDFSIYSVFRTEEQEMKYKIVVEYGALPGWLETQEVDRNTPLIRVDDEITAMAHRLVDRMTVAGMPMNHR